MSKITTEHLELKVRSLEDVDALVALYADPAVTEFIGGALHDRDTVVKAVFLSDNHWRKNGFGSWSIVLKGKKELIGAVGLKRLPDAQVELFIHLAKKHWKKGYATEACQAVLDFGFRLFKLKKVIAHAPSKNPAPLKLMAKLGFVEIGKETSSAAEILFEKIP